MLQTRKGESVNESEGLRDYAYPAMMAERALADVHKSFINGDKAKALDKGIEAVKWVAEVLECLRDGQTKSKND
jgi:hypothetical protein